MRFKYRAGRSAVAVALLMSVIGLAGVSTWNPGLIHANIGFAAASTPPAPPTYVPTPIGPPPGPPTSTPTATPTGPTSATATAVTPTASAITADFSLDAARVSKLHNPGNLRGLVSVRRGTQTWLMMYFTVRKVSQKMPRITRYTVYYKGKRVFDVSYKSSIRPTDVGRFSRYSVFSVPRSFPGGRYEYRASLQIGSQVRVKYWGFVVAQREREIAG